MVKALNGGGRGWWWGRVAEENKGRLQEIKRSGCTHLRGREGEEMLGNVTNRRQRGGPLKVNGSREGGGGGRVGTGGKSGDRAKIKVGL